MIKEVLGRPVFTHFSTWNNQSNILFAAGIKFNESVISKLNKNALELAEKRKKMEEDSIKDVEEDNVTFDTSAILSNNSIKKTSASQTQSNYSRRRRRSETSGSETVNKYKNM